MSLEFDQNGTQLLLCQHLPRSLDLLRWIDPFVSGIHPAASASLNLLASSPSTGSITYTGYQSWAICDSLCRVPAKAVHILSVDRDQNTASVYVARSYGAWEQGGGHAPSTALLLAGQTTPALLYLVLSTTLCQNSH